MSKKSEKNPILTILLIFNTSIVCFLLYNQYAIQDSVNSLTNENTVAHLGNDPELPFYPKAEQGRKIIEFPFGKFTTNLARESGPQRFMNLDITLLIESPIKSSLEEIQNLTPTLRDEVISILNNLEPKDVLKLEGREVLKDLLKKHINHKLKTDNVRRILFTKFKVS